MFLVFLAMTGLFQAEKYIGAPPAKTKKRAMQPVPKPVAISRAKASRQFQRQWPVTRPNKVFPQLNLVRRENADAAPTARNGDIPLLRIGCGLNGGIRKQDVIYSLALRPVGRYCVTGEELTKSLLQCPAVSQFNSPIADSRHRDEFSIGRAT